MLIKIFCVCTCSAAHFPQRHHDLRKAVVRLNGVNGRRQARCTIGNACQACSTIRTSGDLFVKCRHVFSKLHRARPEKYGARFNHTPDKSSTSLSQAPRAGHMLPKPNVLLPSRRPYAVHSRFARKRAGAAHITTREGECQPRSLDLVVLGGVGDGHKRRALQ